MPPKVDIGKHQAELIRAQRSSASTSSRGSASGSSRAAPSAPPSSTKSSIRGPSRVDGPDEQPSGDARDPVTARSAVSDPKMFELGGTAWATHRGYDGPSMPPRPGLSKLGVEKKTGLNTFNVEQIPGNKVYQFEVLVGSGTEKRGVIMKVWESNAVKQQLGPGFIFDGNRLAWSSKPIEREMRLNVDLDVEQGRQPREGKPNSFRIAIRQTNIVRFDVLQAHLTGGADFDNSVLEAINFMDHALREMPSKRLTAIKRSFFQKGQRRFDLGGGIEAFKGVYQSLRISAGSGPKQGRLSINVDVANGTFYTHCALTQLALSLTGARDLSALSHNLKGSSAMRENLVKKLRKIHVIASHRGGVHDEYVIDSLVFKSAKDQRIDTKDAKSGAVTSTSLYDFYAKKYNVRIQYPDLPLVKMTKGKNTFLPMEIIKVKENQRYPFKLDERQTANMIKVAVEPPGQRWESIKHGLNILDWANDPVLKHFGMKINPNKTVVNSRLLVAPKVQFNGGDAKPGTSGRWDLKGKKFLQGNLVPLKSWSVCVITGRRGGKPDKTVVENFLRSFCTTFGQHGGRVDNKAPAMVLHSSDDPGAAVTAAWNAAGNQSNSRPQMLVFVLPDKDSTTYGRIKRSAECRYGVVSQCMQYAHVQKCQGQYISNVCMKFNAKLGGITCRAIGPKTGGPTGIFNSPTVIMGADVSHASPGSQNPSMAALTMSQDQLAVKYTVVCETNGFRTEMITSDNITSMMKPQLQHWVQNAGRGKWPQRIIYLRDGVSEGQYSHVLQQEVADMKKLIKTADPNLNIPFVVIVGGKRHHVRFFPEGGSGDRNGNPLPGTLVETGVTHPFENDFYLCSHAAIKGTARPVHYYVLLNEAKMSNDEIHTMLYEHSYQYMRATTPVSLHPAIYYAHLAAERATPHDPKWGGSSDGAPSSKVVGSQSGSQGAASRGSGAVGSGQSSGGPPPDCEKLMPMPNQGGINSVMWYI